MKSAVFFTLFVFLNLYSDVECQLEFIKKMFHILIEPPPPAPKEASLVLGVEHKSRFCVIANCPILRNRENAQFGKYLFACPAETPEEIKLNLEKSKTKQALFIKKSYGEINLENSKKNEDNENSPPTLKDLDENNYEFVEYHCKYPLGEPSIKYVGSMDMNGTVVDHFLIGFEVYMGDFKTLNFVDYKKFTNTEQGFQWFNVILVRIDQKRGNVLTVSVESFNDDSNFPAPMHKRAENKAEIRSNSLGNDVFFKNFAMGDVYSYENQNLVFNRLFKDSPMKRDLYLNKDQNRYLVETYLAPLESFVSPLLEQAALTYANISPMWKLIKETSWKRLENHIEHLVQGLYGVYVVNGTYGTLTLSGEEIYLGSWGKVRVPLAFYKIVTYPRKDKELYNMLIITMNNPYENASHGLCKSQCKQFGWDFIEQDLYPYGRTSCCPLTDEIINELQLQNFVFVDHVLDLRAVPHRDNEKLTLNLTNFIEDRKKGFSYNPNMRADHLDYRNEKDILLDDEKKPEKKKNDLSDFSFSEFAVTVFKDYLVPGLSSLSMKAKDYAGSKVSSFRGQKDETGVKNSVQSDQKDGVEATDRLENQKDNVVEQKDSLDDKKAKNEVERSLPDDQTDDIAK